MRVVFFNKTTFDQAGLKYPPPHGSWGSLNSQWTWSAFTSTIATLATVSNSSGFDWMAGMNEEEILFSLLLESKTLNIVNKNGSMYSCGFNSPDVAVLLDSTVKKWFVTDKTAATSFVDTNSTEFKSWVSSGSGNQLDTVVFPGMNRSSLAVFIFEPWL